MPLRHLDIVLLNKSYDSLIYVFITKAFEEKVQIPDDLSTKSFCDQE